MLDQLAEQTAPARASIEATDQRSSRRGGSPVTSNRMFEQLADLVPELDKLEAELPRHLRRRGTRRALATRAGASRSSSRSSRPTRVLAAREAATSTTPASCSKARPMPRCATTCGARSPTQGSAARGARGRIKELLLPRDPNEGRNVIIEIQGTEGGEEANLWAGDLFRMYQRFAERHGWKLEVLVEPAVGAGRLPRRHVRR